MNDSKKYDYKFHTFVLKLNARKPGENSLAEAINDYVKKEEITFTSFFKAAIKAYLAGEHVQPLKLSRSK